MQVARPEKENPLDLVPIAPHLRGSEVLKMLHEDNPDSGEGSWVTHQDDKGPSKGMRNRANWPVSRRQVCWPPKPEYDEIPPAPETNQVPVNQAPVNHVSANQPPPLSNHTSDNQVAINGTLVNQAPSSRTPERPAAPAPVAQEQAPSLPPTGAKVPPPVPPRPANYPQVGMEVQQQALQQVNEQMQHQSMMSSSSSSRQEPQEVTDGGPVAPSMTTQFPAGFKLRDEAPVQQTPPAMILSQPAFKITQPLKQKGESKWPPKGDTVTQEQVREFTKPKGGKRDYTEFFAQNALPQTFNCYRPPPGTQHRGEEATGVSEM